MIIKSGAFTITRLISEVAVQQAPVATASTVTSPTGSLKFEALWDTGASRTAISQKVVNDCKLTSPTILPPGLPAGFIYHQIQITLPNGFITPPLFVRQRNDFPTDCKCDIMLGMDALRHCDIALTHQHNNGCFSFSTAPTTNSIPFPAVPKSSFHDIYLGRPFELLFDALLKNPVSPHINFRTLKVLWDTGAPSSGINQSLVSELNLPGSWHGYGLEIELPNQVYIPAFPVKVRDGLRSDIAVLIGMDIIRQGDFAFTNSAGNTVVYYRKPSLGGIVF